jgi:hypothetical protein
MYDIQYIPQTTNQELLAIEHFGKKKECQLFRVSQDRGPSLKRWTQNYCAEEKTDGG